MLAIYSPSTLFANILMETSIECLSIILIATAEAKHVPSFTGTMLPVCFHKCTLSSSTRLKRGMCWLCLKSRRTSNAIEMINFKISFDKAIRYSVLSYATKHRLP